MRSDRPVNARRIEQLELPLPEEAAALGGLADEDAACVAARRADALFGSGDTTSGMRWLKLFRKLALAHRRSGD